MSTSVINDMYNKPDSVKNIIEKAYQEMISALEEYNKAFQRSEQISNNSWTDVTTHIQELRDKINNVTEDLSQFEEMTDTLSDYRSIIENLEDLWINVKKIQ